MYCFYLKRKAGAFSGIAMVVALILAVEMLSACAGRENNGRLMGVKGIYEEMRQGPIGEDYQYFMTPPVARPDAVIAIHKNYTLKTGLWRRITFETGESKGWSVCRRSMGPRPKLLEIQGPGGEHIGLWYSAWTNGVVKMLGDGVVQVSPPNTALDSERCDR